jgi:hypothetical protein
MHYLTVIDIVSVLNNDKEGSFRYCAEINAASKFARIAVYDGDGIKIGYLGDLDIITTELKEVL